MCMNHIHRFKIDSIRASIINGKLDISWAVVGDFDPSPLIFAEDENHSNLPNECDWIRCGHCNTWQHMNCVRGSNRKIVGKTYKCPLLCSHTSNIRTESSNIKSEFHRRKKVIELIGKLGGYRRLEKLPKYGGNKKLPDYEGCNTEQLLTIARKRGINAPDSMPRSDLIRTIVNHPVFTQTHPDLAYFMASIGKQKLKTNYGHVPYIAEFGAGNGNITKCIAFLHPNAVIDAFEINNNRISAAKQRKDIPRRINWIACNLLGNDFVKKTLESNRKYDLIEFNPKFEIGFECIYLALLMLKKNGSIIALLPDDFFEGTPGRTRLSNILPFKIVERHFVGRWGYYPVFDEHGNIKSSQNKVTSDSIFVLRDCTTNKIEDKFDYKAFHPLLDGILTSK